MDPESRSYFKKRREFGNPVNFKESKIVYVGQLPQIQMDKERGFSSEEIHLRRDPNFKTFSNIPKMSENTVKRNPS